MTTIRLAEPRDWKPLAEMRAVLWPESSYEEHLAEVEAGPATECQPDFPVEWLVAEDEDGALSGVLEVEGWFVREEHRRKGIGRALLRAAEDWARARGCIEMASDARMDNALSETTHIALGFEVAERSVLFRKRL